MANYFIIGLGTSHPRGNTYLDMASNLVMRLKNAKYLSQSEIQLSGGVGTDEPLTFWNKAICIRSPLNPTTLWFELAAIETRLGRIRTKINAPRTIDLDLLWWSNDSFRDGWITLPHPRLYKRTFAIGLAQQALLNFKLNASGKN